MSGTLYLRRSRVQRLEAQISAEVADARQVAESRSQSADEAASEDSKKLIILFTSIESKFLAHDDLCDLLAEILDLENAESSEEELKQLFSEKKRPF